MVSSSADSEARSYRNASPGLAFFLTATLSLVLMFVDHRGDYLGQIRTWLSAAIYPLQGAINSPAGVVRAGVPDPDGRLGQRTFLHPVVMTAAVMEQRVEGWAGAPQSLYSDHYLRTQPIDGPMGFKIEAPPLHPLILATSMPCLLYTSDAADDLLCVDLGGRRIITKKKNTISRHNYIPSPFSLRTHINTITYLRQLIVHTPI